MPRNAATIATLRRVYWGRLLRRSLARSMGCPSSNRCAGAAALRTVLLCSRRTCPLVGVPTTSHSASAQRKESGDTRLLPWGRVAIWQSCMVSKIGSSGSRSQANLPRFWPVFAHILQCKVTTLDDS